MSTLNLGILCGLVFGAVAVVLMLPMRFTDKRAALSAAFINRFAIGAVIGAVALPWPGWLIGIAIGLLLSLPEAIVTGALAPIVGLGTVGGAIIGWVVHGSGA
jgi:hypothetical protein